MSVQATFSATLVDEWARLGVTDAVICSGSRSTPLAVALAERLRTHVRLDERSAAFFALGLALATGRPTIICVTSGTAAVELHPAVVESHHARVPLIVCTADRPPELHDTGAPQTIEQEDLFASAVRWAAAPGVPTAGLEETWRPLAVRAFSEAVHGATGPGRPRQGLPPRPGPRVVIPEHSGAPSTGEPLAGRGIVVVGGQTPEPRRPALVQTLSERLGWPVLADPGSRSRVPGTIAAADAIVRTHPPLAETVVLLGTPWLSKALGDYVSGAARAGARVVVVDPWGRWPDPLRAATEFHRCGTDRWLSAAIEHAAPCDPEWLGSWRLWEERAQAAITAALGSDLNEPQVARAVHLHAAESGATLVVSASMPVRDLEWFAPAVSNPPRVLANRGANGIDGVVSTALGVASSGSNQRTVALLGDLAFLHDVSGLVNLPEVPCTFVVLDNGGGGIFSFLPQATSVEEDLFERLFGTPPTSDLGAVARGFGLRVRDVAALSELAPALQSAAAASSSPSLIRVVVPGRTQNVALHDAINQAVRLALT